MRMLEHHALPLHTSQAHSTQFLHLPTHYRVSDLKRVAEDALHLNTPRLWPSTAAAIIRFRAARGIGVSYMKESTTSRRRRNATGITTPPEVLPLVMGDVVELRVASFPRSTCFVMVDLEAFAIRWTRTHFICLHTVGQIGPVSQAPPAPRSSRCSRISRLRSSTSRCSLASQAIGTEWGGVLVTYSDGADVPRMLELRMSQRRANLWVDGLKALLQLLPSFASPAHVRWVMTCMAATSASGKCGYLRRAELRRLMGRANTASSGVSVAAIEEAIRVGQRLEQQLELPTWLKSSAEAVNPSQYLGARQVTRLLVHMSTKSQVASELFNRHAVNGRMGSAGWEQFTRTEQLGPPHGYGQTDDQLLGALDESSDLHADAGLCAEQFVLRLLNPQNDAVAVDIGAEHDPLEPFAHYWTSASHNTYIVGDQLTARSKADMYRRQLLQVSRLWPQTCAGVHRGPRICPCHRSCVFLGP